MQKNKKLNNIIVFYYRRLEEDYFLVEAQLLLPIKYVSKLRYKYIVWKKKEKKEGGKYEWEHLVGFGAKCNRCLQIPTSRCKSGGISNSIYTFLKALRESLIDYFSVFR